MLAFRRDILVSVSTMCLLAAGGPAAAEPYTYRWAVSLGAGGTDVPAGVAFDSAGNILVVGAFDDTFDFDPTAGTDLHTSNGLRDVFVTRLTPNGGYGWTRTWGGADTDWAEGVAVDIDDSVMVTGRFLGEVDFDPQGAGDVRPGWGDYDIFATRLGADGSYQWTWAVGGPGIDGAFLAVRDSHGDWIIGGAFHDTVDFDQTAGGVDEHTSNGTHDLFVTKLGADGSYHWTRTLGGQGTEVVWGLAVDSRDDIVFTGRFMYTVDFDPGPGQDIITTNGENDVFVTKLDNDGGYLWTRTFGGTGTDGGWRLAVDADDAIYTTGWVLGTGAPVDFDPTEGVDQRMVNGIASLFVQKLEADGSYGWTYLAGGSGYDSGKFITVTPGGLVVATGSFEGTVDFDAAGGGDVRTSAGSADVCVVALGRNGDHRWTMTLGGTGADRGESVGVDPLGRLTVVGQFEGTMDLDPTGGVANHTAVGGNDIFVVNLQTSALADFDGDGDVDLDDLEHFEDCATGPDVPQNDAGCRDAALDGDQDVDQDEFGLFQACLSSPPEPSAAGCW